jgi:hypothetical protein
MLALTKGKFTSSDAVTLGKARSNQMISTHTDDLVLVSTSEAFRSNCHYGLLSRFHWIDPHETQAT